MALVIMLVKSMSLYRRQENDRLAVYHKKRISK